MEAFFAEKDGHKAEAIAATPSAAPDARVFTYRNGGKILTGIIYELSLLYPDPHESTTVPAKHAFVVWGQTGNETDSHCLSSAER
jgi:hypothetical protein